MSDSRLFDPGPAEQKSLVEVIVELCEDLLEVGEFDAYEEGVKAIRRACLRVATLEPPAASCGRDICPPTSDCRICR